jgi:hypothetical protein
MGAARENTEADFDLERFIDMFDEALTSTDERVVNALRSLMMMVILTKPETKNFNGDVGPLRQLYDDLHNINRRMHSMEDTVRQLEYQYRREFEEERMRRESRQWPANPYSAKDIWNSATPVTMTDEQYKLAMRGLNSPTPKLKKL